MPIALPSVGTPAQPFSTNWQPSYREKLLRRLKKLAGKVAEVTFGCHHRHITLPFNDRQTCLDCGRTRLYIFNTEMYLGGLTNAPIFIGCWRRPIPEPRGERPGSATRPAGFERVFDASNRIVDRHDEQKSAVRK